MKTAYTPFFGHSTMKFDDKVDLWKELSKNIISGAPKHSAILEMV